MKEVTRQYPEVFTGLGRVTGVPDIHIEMDEMVPPVHQKQRQIPIHYKPKLNAHLEELIREGVVMPFDCANGTSWIHNVVITAKKGVPDQIRINLDTRPMRKAVIQPQYHILTPQELRYEF